MEELRQFYRFRPDEIFRRVTVSSLVGLMIEVSKQDYQVKDPKLKTAHHLISNSFEIRQEEDTSLSSSSRKTSSADSEYSNELNSSVSEQDQQEVQQTPEDLGCDNDSLDGEKGNPEEQVVPLPVGGDMFESVVFKGKMLRRTLSTHSQLHSSLGDLIAGVSNLDVHRPHNQQVNSARPFHHQVSIPI